MIFRICLVSLICIVWLCSARTNNTVLSSFIEKSASLARISAAISIHNGIYSKNSIVQEVTAEFLDISPPVAKELLEHNYGLISENMDKFYGSLSKIPAKLQNGDELINTINLLLDMKLNEEYLKPGTIGDQTEHFSKTTEIMRNSISKSDEMLDAANLKMCVKFLQKVKETESQTMKTDDIVENLSKLKYYLIHVVSQLNLMVNYKTVLKDYLSLESLSDDLQSVENAAKIAGRYSKTIEELDPFRNDLIAASKDTDKIKEATNEILKYSESIQNLFQKSTLLNLNARKYDGKVITSGLLGYKDLDNIWKDFENPWFRQNVLSNLDSTSLKEGLKSLKPFVSALDSLIPSKRLDDKKDTKTILDLAKKISKIHEVGSKVKNAINVTTPFKEVSNCIEPLKPIQNPPDQAMLQRIVDYSGEVVRNVKTFSKLMDDLNKNGLQSIITVSEQMVTNIELVRKTKNDSLKIEMWEKTRKMENGHNLAETLQWITEILSEDTSTFFVEDREIDYTVIQSVSTVFEGTNVESVLNCIKRSYVDNLIGMFEFVDQSDTLKNQKTEFTTATDFIENLLKMQTNFQNLIKKTKSAKVSKESQALLDSKNFKEIGKNSKVIGASVAALRAIETISKAENSIRSVVKMDSAVKFEIQKSLGLKSTDTLIHEMKQVQTSVGEILKVLEAKRIDSISEIQSILIFLSKLKNQPDIEDDNIPTLALDLSNQANPKLQSLAKELLAISRLDMRFANHQKSFDLKNALESTKNMLVSFMQDNKKVAKEKIIENDEKKSATPETSSDREHAEEIIFYIVMVLMITGILVTFILPLDLYMFTRYNRTWFFIKTEWHRDNVAKKRQEQREQEKKSEDKKKKEETKEKSKISQNSQIPKSAEQ
ncbi:hypothetical protein B9Z55_003259 [Caenorhabditis nigoni]|uniref:Domain of unknown function WSN domain-containing protein n=1 Tax=Caenorhabditis nigoni TaxID=1611254 RepID=A0A2G5VPL4_9PELO|nr:hypothetical protein B9Z55_003259 [Caenorhabditis nigoni]